MEENNTTVAEPKLSFDPNNFAEDMAKLAASKGIDINGNKMEAKQEVPAVITPPTTPEQPPQETVEAPVTKEAEATKTEVVVPEKFKNPDGSVNVDNLAKSTQNVEEAIATYLAKEKELKRKMNEVKAKENAYIKPVPAPNAPAPVVPVNTNFAAQLEADIAKEGAGVVLAKLFTAAQESVEERVQSRIQALQDVNAQNTTKQQVEAIGKSDPWVYTPEGVATLTKVLEEQPYLQAAEDPYKAAYLYYSGIKSVASKSSSQVLTPTPQARPSAPVPTGQAVNRTSAPVIKLETKEDIDNHIKKLTPEERKQFFIKAGYPAF